MKTDNLNGSETKNLLRRVRNLETRSPMRSASVTDGNTNFIGNESLTVTGSQKVSGWLIITGTLKGVGELLWEGIVNLVGSMSVKSTGKIVVEGSNAMTLGVGAFGLPGVGFATGGGVSGYTGGAFLHGGSNTVGCIANATVATLSGGINTYVAASSTKINVSGRLEASGAAVIAGNASVAGSFFNAGITTTTSAANVFADSTGAHFKSSSAARFKIDPQPMELPDALLDVPVKDWIDLGNAERFAAAYGSPRPFTEQQQLSFDGVDLARVPGVIAEEVEAAGGEAFVTYDASGRVEGVAYDRLALARTEILARRQSVADARIEALESSLEKALGQIAELRAQLAA